MVLNFSAFVKEWWWLILAVIALLILAFWMWTQSKGGRPIWDKAKLRLPFLGNVMMASFHTQFLETLASLSTGGLPLLKGLELASRVSSNRYVQHQLESVIVNVRDGAALSRALEKTALFPARLLEMVRIGEHTGEIGNALRRTADRCGRDLDKSLEKAMALMQPVIILVMAGLVGVMAYMMISVIFETVSSLKTRH
jgi:type II secretory pathway component PulF